MIPTLIKIIAKSLAALAEFLTVLMLGLLAVIFLVIPWVLRTISLFGWLMGTYLLWISIDDLYNTYAPTLPLLALSSTSVILSVALVVWILSHRPRNMLWGAMSLWGVIGWLFWRGAKLLASWDHGLMIIQIFPAALSAVMLVTMTIRWGSIIRSRRLSMSNKGDGTG